MSMKWTKSPPELVKKFEKLVPGAPAQMRQMFGYPACFVNGNMFMGLHQDNMVLRLPDTQRAAFLKLNGAGQFEPMPGRPMKEYVTVPPALLKTPKKLEPWVAKALKYGASLKPKAPKKKVAKPKK
jgi:TfoX/Sxy family transcriptional regulator of competence genes